MPSLAVWMNGERVGTWSVSATGSHRFVYANEWMTNPRARPISLSLPLTAGPLEGDKVRNFFDNLLPDSEGIRLRIKTRLRLKRADAFSLLQAIGRDCVGAVQLLPLDMAPVGFDQMACHPLSDTEIENHLRAPRKTRIFSKCPQAPLIERCFSGHFSAGFRWFCLFLPVFASRYP